MSPILKVLTQTLRSEAGVWDAQAEAIADAGNKADGLHLNRIEAGVFQAFVTAYGTTTGEVVARCREGEARMKEIANALRKVAGNYDKTEAEGAALFKQIF
ncbi:type VII secretion target [Actinomadura syzygii]|uniref:ESX-1 secretion-associated protein n=1 Tax=Actinomadura syzygii TaxID=1427538 RepID=A0A5D0ULE5_9ACTN|nr:type VII secretion target [Actinomadura syzygii]TYC18443.1 hypothetical protein FXF65_01385 [Actinomadura syzygii]